MLITFVTACAPYHQDWIERARATVEAQTILCDHIVVYDWNRRGAGWARNEGLRRVETPFVSFLDCDDTLEPTFTEDCLTAYDGKHYVYTDWVTDHTVEAPDCAWKGDGGAHIITTLLPTAWVKYVGGFDEQLRAGEDTEFWWKLTRAGLCGKRLPKALFHYGAGGKRSKDFHASADFQSIMQRAIAPYLGLPMGCCTDNVIREEGSAGQPQQGDVLANILWQGGRQTVGRATNRLYRKTGNSRQMWVNPADIDASPQMFSRVIEMPAPLDPQEMARFKSMAHDALGVRGVSAPTVPAGSVEVSAVPDVRRVLELYGQNSHSL